MRQKLIQELQERVHLDHDTAERAADVAVQLVKERLPEQLRPYLSTSRNDRSSDVADGFLN